MARLNWKVVLDNLNDARLQLEEIERSVNDDNKPSGVKLQIKLEHAFHHLCVAWNARSASTKRYSNFSDEDFNEWSKFPKDIEPYRLEIPSDK